MPTTCYCGATLFGSHTVDCPYPLADDTTEELTDWQEARLALRHLRADVERETERFDPACALLDRHATMDLQAAIDREARARLATERGQP